MLACGVKERHALYPNTNSAAKYLTLKFDPVALATLPRAISFQVGFYSQAMGRTGARPTIHSILHTVEAVRLHGETREL